MVDPTKLVRRSCNTRDGPGGCLHNMTRRATWMWFAGWRARFYGWRVQGFSPARCPRPGDFTLWTRTRCWACPAARAQNEGCTVGQADLLTRMPSGRLLCRIDISTGSRRQWRIVGGTLPHGFTRWNGRRSGHSSRRPQALLLILIAHATLQHCTGAASFGISSERVTHTIQYWPALHSNAQRISLRSGLRGGSGTHIYNVELRKPQGRQFAVLC